MTDKAKTQAGTPVVTPAVDRQVVAELVARAQADGVSISGESGLLAQLTKIVLESSLAGEMDAHLGYDKHDPAGRDGGNSRNGSRSKTVLTEAGPVEITVPREWRKRSVLGHPGRVAEADHRGFPEFTSTLA